MLLSKYTTYGQIRNYIITHYSKSHPFLDYSEVIRRMDTDGLLLPVMPDYPDYLGTENSLTLEQTMDFFNAIPLDVTHFLYGQTGDNLASFQYSKDISCSWHMPYANEMLHTHEKYEIIYTYHGTCCLSFENEKKMFNAGNLFIITPNSRHNIITSPESIAISIFVRRNVFDDVIGSLLSDNDLVSSLFRHTLYDNDSNYLNLSGIEEPPYRKNIMDIFFECTNQRKYNRACSLGFFIMLIACSLRRYNSSMTFHKTAPPTQRDNFVYILEYMQQNYRTITLQTLAETFHYTPAYLSKLFKKNIRKNFSDALQELKMQKALEYLANPNIKITELADLVGYESTEHFSRTFKRHFGISPLKYRMQNFHSDEEI